jgi:hypothetical protein
VTEAMFYLTSILGQMPKRTSFIFLFYGLLLELFLLAFNLLFLICIQFFYLADILYICGLIDAVFDERSLSKLTILNTLNCLIVFVVSHRYGFWDIY